MLGVESVYHRWLDRWDERRAQRGDAVKQATGFAVDADLAFEDMRDGADFSEMCARAEQASTDPSYFALPEQDDLTYDQKDGWLTFKSCVVTGIKENDLVWAEVTESGPSAQTLVIFHQWNAKSRSARMAKFFSARGINVVQVAMPYHFERRRPGSTYADFMLSSNLGRTIQSMRQAVLDGRKLVRILQEKGCQDISVLGISLGGWVAGLLAAHDPNVKKAALFLAGGSLADMAWTGRATRHIRASLAPNIELGDLRKAWSPLDLGQYAQQLARSDLDLLLVVAQRDTVVLPEISTQLIERVEEHSTAFRVMELNCGHYSLSLPQYIIRAGSSVVSLMADG